MKSAHSRVSFRTGIYTCYILLTVAAFASGCRRAPTTPPETSYISTTIAGQITDESGAPLAGVSVTAGPLGSTVAMTDANGLYSLHNVSAQADHAFIITRKPGYFNGARAGIPSMNGVTYLNLSMASSATIGTIDAASGGTVALPSGGSISLRSGGVVTSSGSAYTGMVSISAKHLDPTSANFSKLFAGDLKGQHSDGTSAELESYGVILAELHGSNGEMLQPASGSPATLTMPIAATQQASAPATIPLWYFNETIGLWKEEGSATKQGTIYVGTVNHFSSWNCDWSGPWGQVKGQILCSGVPIPTVVVNLGAPGEQVITDGGGFFTARVPADPARIPIAIQVIGTDNHGLFYMLHPIPVNVPANGTVDMGQITLDSHCPSYLAGTLENCSNRPTPGMVMANYSGGMSYVYTADGNFRITAPAGTAVILSATASTGDIAQPQSMTAGLEGIITSTPNLVACSSQTSDINLDISGTYTGKALAFSPDGSKLATIASNGTDVVLLDATTGNTLVTLPAAFSKYAYSPSIQFSGNGNTILTTAGYYGGFDCWKLDGTRLTPSTVSSISAVPSIDGASVIGSDQAHGVFKYDIGTHSFAATYSVPSTRGPGMVMGLMPSGTQFVVSSANTVYLWDMNTNQAVSSFLTSSNVQDSMAQGSALSPDGSIICLSASSMKFFGIATGTAINTSTISQSYGQSFGILPDNSRFIAQYRSGLGNTVGLFNITNGIPSYLFDAPSSFGNSSAVAISHNGKLAAAVYANNLRIWSVK
ncbi:MAG: hypothetical protein Q8902_05640 [Bacteroidota bacterium]|nr:hypothetical protein [Bacteroidota bacterium]MDP4232795.1 hypothetical protein [Bacteroidota bacterium]MDP4242524.1 hypothetical protein [Bacteroidota bacterium]